MTGKNVLESNEVDVEEVVETTGSTFGDLISDEQPASEELQWEEVTVEDAAKELNPDLSGARYIPEGATLSLAEDEDAADMAAELFSEMYQEIKVLSGNIKGLSTKITKMATAISKLGRKLSKPLTPPKARKAPKSRATGKPPGRPIRQDPKVKVPPKAPRSVTKTSGKKGKGK